MVCVSLVMWCVCVTGDVVCVSLDGVVGPVVVVCVTQWSRGASCGGVCVTGDVVCMCHW